MPLNIDIIKHKHEIDGKSTAGHAAILAPDYVKIYTYPNIPDYSSENTVLIFPSFKARTLNEIFFNNQVQICNEDCENITSFSKGSNPCTLLKKIRKHSSKYGMLFTEDLPISKAVFIDSTWNQSKGIYKDHRIKHLPCVVLQNRASQFWRHQKGSPRWYLATIEAIHQFLIEVHLNAWGIHPEYKGLKNCFSDMVVGDSELMGHFENVNGGYNGQYDNLLFFFQHMYTLIHTFYEHEDLYAYKRRLS